MPLRLVRLTVVLSSAVVFAALSLYLDTTASRFGPTLDDSYIHLQFARSLASGDGMSYRDATPVSGSTGPLWTSLLSVGHTLSFWSGAPPETSLPLFTWLLSGVLLTLAALELSRLASSYGLPCDLVILGTLWFLLCDLTLWSAASGMEILLFLWLSTWGMRLHQQLRTEKNWTATASVLALGCLARPEGALLLLLACCDRAWARRRGRTLLAASLEVVVSSALPIVVLLVPFALFGLWNQGTALPTTFAVKTDAVHRGYPALRDFWRAGEVLFRSLPLATALAAGGALELIRRAFDGASEPVSDVDEKANAHSSLLPALWLIGLPAAYSSLSEPNAAMPLGNFGRYVYPLIPALILLGLLALAPVWTSLTRTAARGTRPRGLAAVLIALLVAPGLGATRAGLARTTRNVLDVETGDVAMARWLSRQIPPGARIGAQDIGAIGYLTDHPLFDLVGLVDPEVIPVVKNSAPSVTGFDRLRELLRLARHRRVDLLVVFPESYGGLPALEAAAPGPWSVLHTIEIPGNITLAGKRLSVLRPPWSRIAPEPRTDLDASPQR